jgi:hypothetical protein
MEQRQPGHARSDAQTSCAELALLHSLLAHYARLLWDIQRTRIALSNRAGAMERDGLAEQWRLPLVAVTRELAVSERAINLQLTRRRHGTAAPARPAG